MDHKLLHEDIWTIFSRPNNSALDARFSNAADIISACKELDIELTYFEQDAINDDTTFDRKDWMDLLQNEAMDQLMEAWEKLYPHYWNNIDRDSIKTTEDALACYQWRLPKFQPSQIEMLCSGFIRQHTNTFIPNDIIGVMVHYVFDNIVHNIKMSKNLDVFESGIFEYKSCKFCLIFYPKGENEWEMDNEKSKSRLNVKIMWLSAPEEIRHIEASFSFNFAEKFISICKDKDEMIIFGYRGSTSSILYDADMSIDQINHLNSFTFNLFITKFVARGKTKIGSVRQAPILFADNHDPPAALIIESGSKKGVKEELSTRAAEVLTSLFQEFATNEDGTMSIDDMKKYIIHCGAGEMSASDQRVQGIFDRYGTEKKEIIDDDEEEDTVQHQDRLSCEGFLNFYKQACIERPQHVWNDIKVFGYGDDLEKKQEKTENDDIKEEKYKYMKPIILDESMCQSQNTETFRWQLSDDDMIKIKDSKPKDVVLSDMFMMHGLKWQFWLFVCCIYD